MSITVPERVEPDNQLTAEQLEHRGHIDLARARARREAGFETYAQIEHRLAANDPHPESEEPTDLPTSRNTAPFCAGVLGDVVGDFVQAVSDETATPVDLAALAALGVCSTVIAGSIVVEADPGWKEPVNLYTIGLAAPGEGKSPVVRRCDGVLDRIEKDRREAALPEILDAEARKRVAEGRRKRAEDVAAKSSHTDRLEAEQEALEAAREAAGVVVPVAPRMYTREATPEALVKILGEQNGRLGVVTDEGVEFFEMAARYSGTGRGNLGVYLSGHDGGRFVSDRSGRDPIIIEATTLTVCLFAQPVVLSDLGKDRQARGRGLLARFLWSMPRTRVGQRPIWRRGVTPEALGGWEERIVALATETRSVEDEPVTLRMDLAARRLFDAWREEHEPRLAPGVGDLASIVDWGSKLPGQVLRLAGNLHALRTGTIYGTISVHTLAAALELASYFTDHTRAAFGVMGADQRMADAGAVLRWLRDHGANETTTRVIYTSKDWDVDRARSALEVLAEYGWVYLRDRPEGPGRFAERWAVHPKVRRTMAQYQPESSIVRRSAPVIPETDIPAYDAPTPTDDMFYDDEEAG